MYAIFYDLETTDKNPIGQILNYSFVMVDDDLQPIDEISGLVKISRLQLPEAGAILANRTNVLEHQRIASDHERDAMRRIEAFLSACIQRARGAVAFVGYNSSRFDLPYLRTSLVRNGFNPYFGGKLSPHDLLHACQKAYLISAPFRALIKEQRKGEKKLSLSLQTVGKALGLLDGTQAHESREDVMLTIKVAEWLKRECGIDVTTYEPYEGLKLHSTARSGAVYMMEEPEYDITLDTHLATTPMTLLANDNKRALWINLERYSVKQDPSAISWRSAQKSAFFVSDQALQLSDVQALARAAIKQFSAITLANFFSTTTCDIEQFIYRMDFHCMDLLSRAIRENKRELLASLKEPEAKVLFTRYRLSSPELDLSEPASADMLRRYALHRYGAKLQMARTIREEGAEGNYHTTLGQMVQALQQNRDAALLQGNTDDIALLDALEGFYRGSELVRVAGGELLPTW